LNYEWLALVAITFGMPFVAIGDMYRYRATTWRRARQNRPLWIALSILLGPLGAALYATGPRLVLRRTVREMRADLRSASAVT
jgi:hypothetical protein